MFKKYNLLYKKKIKDNLSNYNFYILFSISLLISLLLLPIYTQATVHNEDIYDSQDVWQDYKDIDNISDNKKQRIKIICGRFIITGSASKDRTYEKYAYCPERINDIYKANQDFCKAKLYQKGAALIPDAKTSYGVRLTLNVDWGISNTSCPSDEYNHCRKVTLYDDAETNWSSSFELILYGIYEIQC